jgi:hypothetical protein
MLLSRHTPSVAAVTLATALLFAPSAGARVAKAAAPALTIESKVCNIGPTTADRSAVITAKAAYNAGARVSMKFTMQQRTGKAKWRSLLSKDDGLGVWETTDGEAVDLRYTKTINGLAEGLQYRVSIDARGVSDAGKAVTKTAHKSVTCTQPIFTPTLTLSAASDSVVDGNHQVSATLRNTGRLASGTIKVLAKDAVTRAELGNLTIDSVKGNGMIKITVPLSSCNGQVVLTATQVPQVLPNPDSSAPAPIDPTVTVDCAATPAVRR